VLEEALFGEKKIEHTEDVASILANMHVLKSFIESEKNCPKDEH